MADHNQFGSSRPTQSGDPQRCAQCEAMLMDALDGTLSPDEQAIFDLHLLTCVGCAGMVADAQRGAAWLEMLKSPRPEPSAALLNRILAQTSGMVVAEADAADAAGNSASLYLVPSNTLPGSPTPSSAIAATNVLPFRSRFNLRNLGHNLLQPRLAMTAAMAFFSVALTMNLTGLKLSELRASDLRPSSLKRSISEANAHVVRYYDNLRVVYELESRVHDLQTSSESEGTSAPAKPAPTESDQKPSGNQQPSQQPSGSPDQQKQEKEARPRPRPGTSRREDLQVNLRYVLAEADTSSITLFPALSLPQTLAALSPCMTLGDIPRNTDSKVQEVRLV